MIAPQDHRSAMALKAFLKRCPAEKRSLLEKFLPEEERNSIAALPDFVEAVVPDQFATNDLIDKVHWSWFLPTLKTSTTEEQQMFLAVLREYAAKNLAGALRLRLEAPSITETARKFLRHILLDSLLGEEQLLPVTYLPASTLSPLLSFNKKEMIRLIDLLSMYDLAAELRQIVETKILKKIYSFLSEEEKKLLKSVMNQKEHFILSKLGLDRWDGTEEALRLILHRRGLVRFAAALSGQDPDLVWYIIHNLDIGRGSTLFHFIKEEPLPVSGAIRSQVEEIMGMIQ